MHIKITSLYIGDIYKKLEIKKEMPSSSNGFYMETLSILKKEKAFLLKVGSGYVDLDEINDEKTLKSKYNEINALGDFRNGCGILRDTIPFLDSEGEDYVDYESLETFTYPFKKDKISFKELKKIREIHGKNINNRR